MNGQTQGLVAVALAAVLLRITWTGEYLRFVQSWMAIPLIVTALILLAMALRPLFDERNSASRVPRTSWLLFLPVLVMFTVAPPPLGAFVAERRSSVEPIEPPQSRAIKPNTDGTPVDLELDTFLFASYRPEVLPGLAGTDVSLRGFVSTDDDGNWYVSDLVIFCCAADVQVQRVKVTGAVAPPRDQWVEVTGAWVEGTGADPEADPAEIQAAGVVEIEEPADPYS